MTVDPAVLRQDQSALSGAVRAQVRVVLERVASHFAEVERVSDPRRTISRRELAGLYLDLWNRDGTDLSRLSLDSVHRQLAQRTGFARSLDESGSALRRAIAEVGLAVREAIGADAPVLLEIRTSGRAILVHNEEHVRRATELRGKEEALIAEVEAQVRAEASAEEDHADRLTPEEREEIASQIASQIDAAVAASAGGRACGRGRWLLLCYREAWERGDDLRAVSLVALHAWLRANVPAGEWPIPISLVEAKPQIEMALVGSPTAGRQPLHERLRERRDGEPVAKLLGKAPREHRYRLRIRPTGGAFVVPNDAYGAWQAKVDAYGSQADEEASTGSSVESDVAREATRGNAAESPTAAMLPSVGGALLVRRATAARMLDDLRRAARPGASAGPGGVRS